MPKSLRKSFKDRDFLAICVLIFLSASFFWRYFIKGLIPIPADIIVGIYHPWRDYIWNGFIAGVPFKNSLLSDVVSIIYPWRIYGIGLLKKGIWPLWDHYSLSGTPLLANFQSGLFYPLNVLFLFLSNISAWSIYIILQPVLASIFCFLFLRNLKLRVFSSLTGALIFAFSGFMMVWLEYGILGHAGLWLPLILLTIDKLVKKRSFKWMIVGSLGVAFSILAGYPLISFFVLLTCSLYSVFQVYLYSSYLKTESVSSRMKIIRALKSARTSDPVSLEARRNPERKLGELHKKKQLNKKIILSIFSFLLLGILLSSVQIIPGLELLRFSIRQNDPTTTAFGLGLNPIKSLVLFIAPDFYGNPATGNFWGWGAYNESAGYISVGGFLLAMIGFLFSRRNKRLIFFKALLFLSLLMAFDNPISRLIYMSNLPILASSSAGRFFFLIDFSLAILAAHGLELVLKKKKNINIVYFLIFTSISFFLFLGVIFFKPEIWFEKNLLLNLSVVKRNLILPIFLFFTSLIFIVIFYFARSLKLRKIVLFLLLVCIIFDLFRFGDKYTPFTERGYLYPKTDLTDFLENQDGFYRFTGLIPQSMFIPYALFSPEGYEPLMNRRYSEFANQINKEKFDQISSGSRWVTVNRFDSPLLNILGTKYILSFNSDPISDWDSQDFKYPKEKYELIFQYGKSQVYENKEALPRAFMLHDYMVLNDREIMEILMSDEFDPIKTLLLEKEPEILPEEKIGDDRVAIKEYLSNRVVVETDSLSDGFLFLSDNFYPGWQAFVDGVETKIYRANYTFQAIAIPKGDHTVEFIYDPLSFKLGLTISLLTASGLLGFGAILFLRRKKLEA